MNDFDENTRTGIGMNSLPKGTVEHESGRTAEQVRSYSALGRWETLNFAQSVPAAHAALLPGGRILFLGELSSTGKRRTTALLWDYEASQSRSWEMEADFSLGAQCHLSDGRLLLTGGLHDQTGNRQIQTYLFDPATEEWLRVNDLQGRGQCISVVELGNGRVAAIGGAGGTRSHVYEPSSGWSQSPADELDWPLYPQVSLLADGSLFYSGQHFGGRSLLDPGLLRPDGRFETLPESVAPGDSGPALRDQGASILLPPAQGQRVMVIEAGVPPDAAISIVDFSSGEPSSSRVSPPGNVRANFNTVVLPDRSVLISGSGSAEAGSSEARAEIYDPSTGKRTTAAPDGMPRMKDSTAVLLPDGRVLTVGSAKESGSDQGLLRLYHPPYLFKGDRPQLEDSPTEIAFGESFLVTTADSDIRWASLVKPMAASHGHDSGQRLVDLPFESRRGGLLELTSPANPNIAPPGWYLLFLVNHKGVPSVGRWVLLRRTTPGSLRQSPVAGVAEPVAIVEPVIAPVRPQDEEASSDYVLPRSPRPALETPVSNEALHPAPQAVSTEAVIGRPHHGMVWARPGLIVSSVTLLGLSNWAQIAPLRVAAAFIFLLFAPGLALVGIFRVPDLIAETAMTIGFSFVLAAIPTVVMLYMGNWSAETTALILVGFSSAGALIQFIRAATSQPGREL